MLTPLHSLPLLVVSPTSPDLKEALKVRLEKTLETVMALADQRQPALLALQAHFLRCIHQLVSVVDVRATTMPFSLAPPF